MHTQQLSAHQTEPPHEIERGDRAAIAGEIAERLLEFRELSSPSYTGAFIQKLATIYTIEPAALWLVLKLLSGDMTQLTISYADSGKQNGRSKQAVQQETERILIVLKAHYPQAAEAIIQLRHITAKIA